MKSRDTTVARASWILESTLLLLLRITAAEIKYTRRTAGYTWTDYKTNTKITKELKVTLILEKLLEYKRNWVQHVNRMARSRLPRVRKPYSPTARRNHGRPLKRLLDTWDRNGSTSGPTPWQIYDNDDDDDDDVITDWNELKRPVFVWSWGTKPSYKISWKSVECLKI